MPYTPATNSTIEAVLMMEMDGQQCLNIVHYRPFDPEPGNFTDGAEVLDALANILNNEETGWPFKVSVWTTERLKFRFLQLQFIAPVRYAYKRYVCSVDEGSQVTDPLPPNMAASLTFQADTTDRHSQGRIQIPGLIASTVDGGIVSNTVRGHMDSLAELLRGPMSLGGEFPEYNQVIYNRQLPTTSKVVTHAFAQTTVRTMRRRTVGLGS